MKGEKKMKEILEKVGDWLCIEQIQGENATNNFFKKVKESGTKQLTPEVAAQMDASQKKSVNGSLQVILHEGGNTVTVALHLEIGMVMREQIASENFSFRPCEYNSMGKLEQLVTDLPEELKQKTQSIARSATRPTNIEYYALKPPQLSTRAFVMVVMAQEWTKEEWKKMEEEIKDQCEKLGIVFTKLKEVRKIEHDDW